MIELLESTLLENNIFTRMIIIFLLKESLSGDYRSLQWEMELIML